MGSCWDVIEIVLDFFINLERIDVITILKLPIHEHGMFPHLVGLLWFLSSTVYIQQKVLYMFYKIYTFLVIANNIAF